MSFKQRVMMLSSIGFGLGVIAGTIIAAFTGTISHGGETLYLCAPEFIEAVGDPLTAFTIQAVLLGIYGVLAMGGSAVYSIENWSILRCTVTHYLTVLTGIYVLAFSLRWFNITDTKAILIMFLIMTPPYFLIWLINYISYKSEISKINKELEDIKLMKNKAAN
ncbi:MAG: DUF3021 domain-containing protein [Lachnospiraceae bacterium]|nr:DUF3021 domain-containing protein [Lachnospiraceae bacterium]